MAKYVPKIGSWFKNLPEGKTRYDFLSYCSIEKKFFEDPSLLYCPSCGRKLRHRAKQSKYKRLVFVA